MKNILSKKEWLNNYHLAISECKQKKTILDCWPCSVKVEINNSCNCMCKFCFQANSKSHNKDMLSNEEIDQLFPILQYATYITTSCVAEPFVSPKKYRYLLHVIRKHNPYAKVLVITNGLLMNEEVIDDLINYKCDKIKISIHAIDNYKEFYGNGSFDIVKKNIEKLQNKKRKLGIKYPEIEINHLLTFYSDPFEIVDFASIISITSITFMLVNENKNGLYMNKTPQNNGWTSEFDQYIKSVLNYSVSKKINTSLWYWGNKLSIPDSLIKFCKKSSDFREYPMFFDRSKKHGCPSNAPWFQLNTQMRNVFHCTCTAEVFKWIGKDWHSEIWNGKYFRYLRKCMNNNNYPTSCNCKKFPKIILDHNQIEIKEGDTLYSLLGENWQKIYNLPSNDSFRILNPDPNLVRIGSIINLQ